MGNGLGICSVVVWGIIFFLLLIFININEIFGLRNVLRSGIFLLFFWIIFKILICFRVFGVWHSFQLTGTALTAHPLRPLGPDPDALIQTLNYEGITVLLFIFVILIKIVVVIILIINSYAKSIRF